MVSLNFMHFLSFVYSLCIITIGYGVMASSSAVKAGYYNSGASDNFPPSAINTSLLTYVLYAFLVPNNITFEFDISNSEAASLSNFTTTLHRKNPQVKALYSIGGGGIDPNPFAAMASKASSRRTFIHATTEGCS
jgi:chitinase